MSELTTEEIQNVWDELEKTRLEHPDFDKPDFQFFDPIEYAKAIAKAAVAKAQQKSRPDKEKIYDILTDLRQRVELEDADFHYDAVLEARDQLLALFEEVNDE